MKISQKIIDYAIWYYLKYYPSPKKLERKLLEKFWEQSENGKKYWGIHSVELEYIIEEKLKNIIQEKEVIESKIRSYKQRGKSKQYIKQKLFERQEKRELFEELLELSFVDWELENLKKEYNKIQWKYEKQKILEKLLRKWFRYDDILQIIN